LPLPDTAPQSATLKDARENLERDMILQALRKHGWKNHSGRR